MYLLYLWSFLVVFFLFFFLLIWFFVLFSQVLIPHRLSKPQFWLRSIKAPLFFWKCLCAFFLEKQGFPLTGTAHPDPPHVLGSSASGEILITHPYRGHIKSPSVKPQQSTPLISSTTRKQSFTQVSPAPGQLQKLLSSPLEFGENRTIALFF